MKIEISQKSLFDKDLARRKFLENNPEHEESKSEQNTPSLEAIIEERRQNAEKLGIPLNSYLKSVGLL